MPLLGEALMLRLPSAISVAVATRSYASVRQPVNGLLLPRWTSTSLFARHTPLLPRERRHYATVHVEDTERIWSQYGNHVPVAAAPNGDCVEGPRKNLTLNANPNPEAATQPSSSFTRLSEKDELLAVLQRRARSKNSHHRRKFRLKVKDAYESADALSALRRLVYGTSKQTPLKDEISAEPSPAYEVSHSGADTKYNEVQVVDSNHIASTMSLPTKKQYPQAPGELFDPVTVAAAMHNVCQQLKLSIQIELDYASKQGPSGKVVRGGKILQSGKALAESIHATPIPLYVCTLKLQITNICEESAFGEGVSKQKARQAAWLHLLSKLHAEGILQELFPDTTAQTRNVSGEKEPDEPQLVPAHVDEQTKEDEKDAKTEIYNYAASHGLTPHFEVNIVQPRAPRARFGRIPKKPKPVFQATVRLDDQDINVSAAGKDVQTAEIAAALAFKQEAEKQLQKSNGHSQQYGSSVLNVDTAKAFFDFYKTRVSRVWLETEHEKVDQAGCQNRARVTLDGVAVGQGAIMRTKKEAEAVAYLTAAIEITNGKPELLHEFEQMIKKGKGKALRPVKSVDLQLDFETVHSMRLALVEARKAGLSDLRQSLSAEVSGLRDRYRLPPRRLSLQKREVINRDLLAKQTRFENSPRLQELRSKKARLPMNHYRDQVLSMVSGNPYSIIVGATGSGKTTQVPQILFEDAIKTGKGGSCNIICTQPRRIAATSVARRVAIERDEQLRQTVGYQVRFDSKPPYDPYGCVYCTTGVLLERLKHNPDEALDSVSHLIIDEVHERDMTIDFLMIVLKRAIRTRRADGRSVPKVVLMSATLDMELFARYFSKTDGEGKIHPCPSLNVPGRTFPVKEKYLGSIMDEMLAKHRTSVKALLALDPKTEDYLKVENGFAASRGKEVSGSRADSVIDWKRERQDTMDAEEESNAANEKEEAIVPISLVAATVAHICKSTKDGAILAFLPGLEEILAVQKMLLEQHPFDIDFNDTSKFQLCPLHSTTSPEQQAEIFQPSPPGCRKIILSTNIAETSVTVTEVKFIVDTGKLRELRYDQLRRITKLQCVWESKSNSKQRAGRAGRVQDGFYYALFSKERSESFRAIGLPELLRSDLQETCLSIKSQNFDEPIASFLAQAIEPPPKRAVDAAIQNLVDIEAFTEGQDLTALGRVLSRLPVHPSLGKMIILGVIFKCLDPMIILGAASDERSLFVSPVGLRAEAKRAHASYAGNSQSDQIAFLEAFNELRLVSQRYGRDAVQRRAREKYLHAGAFRTMEQTAKQIEEVLIDSGLISGGRSNKGAGAQQYGPVDLNRNAQNSPLIKCLLLAGLHPNVAAKLSSQGLLYRTPQEQSVLMHPGSLNAEMKTSTKHPLGTLFTYNTLAKSNDGKSLFLRDSTQITPLMAVLFGGQLRMTQDAKLEMDDWLPFFVKATDRQFTTKLILEFRKALDRVLHRGFRSLENLRPESAGEFGDDPVWEQFAGRVVEILGDGPAKSTDAMDVWQSALSRFKAT